MANHSVPSLDARRGDTEREAGQAVHRVVDLVARNGIVSGSGAIESPTGSAG